MSELLGFYNMSPQNGKFRLAPSVPQIAVINESAAVLDNITIVHAAQKQKVQAVPYRNQRTLG